LQGVFDVCGRRFWKEFLVAYKNRERDATETPCFRAGEDEFFPRELAAEERLVANGLRLGCYFHKIRAAAGRRGTRFKEKNRMARNECRIEGEWLISAKWLKGVGLGGMRILEKDVTGRGGVPQGGMNAALRPFNGCRSTDQSWCASAHCTVCLPWNPRTNHEFVYGFAGRLKAYTFES
jgi:hypothetical protein